MKMKLQIAAFCASIFAIGAAHALDATDQRYVDQMVRGGPDTLHEVAESLAQSGTVNPEVLDVAAEVLLQKYNSTAGSYGLADAMAWFCKALAASGNARYKPVVAKVADSAENRKLRGHCSKAEKSFPKKTDVPGYVAGTVNLERLRDTPPPSAGKSAGGGARPKPAAAASGQNVDFNLVRPGMSSEEVESVLGAPTGTRQHMTGKQFQPFNYGARDLQRMIFLYKGVGHIEFSLKSAYEGVYRVIKIVPDTSESGYP